MLENRPKKRLGQHFLKDNNIAKKIVNALPENGFDVIEIGPGRGVLTEFLYDKYGDRLHLVEIDKDLVVFLKNKYPELKKNISNIDFLRIDQRFFTGKKNIIGNFPYNISSQIFFKILEYREYVPVIVCMIQKEVAQRIVSKPGNKTYGILSVLLQAFYNVEYLFSVPPGVFYPPPKVTSSVIKLSYKNEEPSVDFNKFVNVVKTAFNQRRKMLRNSLNIEPTAKQEKLKQFLHLRPEQLSVQDFISLTNQLSEN
ncbi:MAG: 16S rRNA (adenine(1518)-N(6)/adenine(1519)-N(6)) -dimethyltransferase RsmA [Marinilabiliales bacterium]